MQAPLPSPIQFVRQNEIDESWDLPFYLKVSKSIHRVPQRVALSHLTNGLANFLNKTAGMLTSKFQNMYLMTRRWSITSNAGSDNEESEVGDEVETFQVVFSQLTL